MAAICWLVATMLLAKPSAVRLGVMLSELMQQQPKQVRLSPLVAETENVTGNTTGSPPFLVSCRRARL